MAMAEVIVKEHAGTVELHVRIAGDEEPQVIVMDGMSARALGDNLYRAGCNTGL